MCGKGSQTTTQNTSQTQTPNPQAMQLYQDILQQAQGVASTPYQPYPGQLVAPINQQQGYGISNINAYQPAYATSLGMAYNAAQPITAAQIQKYMSPYTQDVINATQAQFANQNAQQQAALTGNAAAQGALGGDRIGVAQANLVNQEQLAQAPVIANLENQGYMTGLNTALTEQQALAQGAYGVANMANAGLGGANAQIGAGTLMQQTQQAQDTAAYQQYLNALGYPFQTTQWLAGLGTGVGSQMGGTTTGYGQTTGPAPSAIGQIGGALTSGVGLLGASGAFGASGWLMPALAALKRGGAVNGYADGGGVAAPDIPIPTIPESHHTLHAQQRQLVSGDRHVHMFPHGTSELPVPHGMKRVVSHSGVFHYNPKKISVSKIHHYSRGGHEHMLLGLGPYSKHEIMYRIANGEHPVAVVERNEHGHEVRAALGTHSTARLQHYHMARTKSKHHTLHVEHPHKVLGERLMAHRQSGGAVTNYSQFGGGYGQPTMPYAGGSSFVPAVGITPGHWAPPAMQAPPAPGQTPSNMMSPENMKGFAGLFKSLQNKDSSSPSGAGNVSSEDEAGMEGDIDWSSAGPDSSNGADDRRGGRVGVANYTDGGTVEPLPMSLDQMQSAFERLSKAGMMNTGQAKDFASARLQRLGINPQPVTGQKAPYARGGVAHRDDGGSIPSGELNEILYPDTTPSDETVSGVKPTPSKWSPPRTPNDVSGVQEADFPATPTIPNDVKGVAEADFPTTNRLPPAVAPTRQVDPEGNPIGTTASGVTTPTPRNLPRGLRNNNPGNIEDGPFARTQPGYVGSDGRFAIFDNINSGKAATSSLLGSYGNKGVNTLSGIINRWAPAADGNDTRAYIAAVARQTGLDPNKPLDMNNRAVMASIADAIHSHENGMPAGYIDRLATQNYNRAYGALDLPPDQRANARAEDTSGVANRSGINWGQDSNLWPALIAAGAGMMSSRSPFPGVAIGEGIGAGAQTYYGMKERQQAQTMSQQKISLEAEKLSKELDLHERQLRETALYHAGELKQRQTEAQLKAQEPKPMWINGEMHYVIRGPNGVFDATTRQMLSGPNGEPVAPESPKAPAAPAAPATNWGPQAPVPGLSPSQYNANSAIPQPPGYQAGGAPGDADSGDADPTPSPAVDTVPGTPKGPDLAPSWAAGVSPAGFGTAPVPGAATPAPTPEEQLPAASAPTEAEGADLPPDLRPTAPRRDEDYLKTLAPGDQRIVKGLVNYKLDPQSFSIRGLGPMGVGGSERKKYLDMAMQYDENYNQALYAAGKKALGEYFAGGNTSPAGVMTAGNTAIMHLKQLDDTVDQLRGQPGIWAGALDYVGNAGLPWLSYKAEQLKNAGLTGTPEGVALQQFETAKHNFTGEILKFYNGGQMTQTERDASLSLLDAAKTPQELHAAIAQDARMIGDKVTQMKNRLMQGMNPGDWVEAMHKDPDSVLLYQNSRNNLKYIDARDEARNLISRRPDLRGKVLDKLKQSGIEPSGI